MQALPESIDATQALLLSADYIADRELATTVYLALKMQRPLFLEGDAGVLLQSIELLLLIVVGGLGSVHGAFFGAIFLISMPQLIALSKDLLPPAIGMAPGLQGVVFGIVLIAFVLFEPMGIYGRWLKIRTWMQLFPFYRKGMFKRQKSFQKSDRLS